MTHEEARRAMENRQLVGACNLKGGTVYFARGYLVREEKDGKFRFEDPQNELSVTRSAESFAALSQ